MVALCHRALLVAFLAVAGCSTAPAPCPDAGPSTHEADADAASADATAPTSHSVLFVGNSYTFVNDVPAHYRAIVQALRPAATVRTELAATGGYLLAQHAQDARTDGTPIAGWLRTGAPGENAFDAVVLQEQSEIGGFPENTDERLASVTAAAELADLARARGAVVVLYATWGREAGDPVSPTWFGTFGAMEDRLDENYRALAAYLRSDGTEVRVAPVGAGFRAVHDAVVARGADPLAEGSDFDALYEPDGSHPSPQGAYLAACILAGTITRADASTFADDEVLGAAISHRLRDVCVGVLTDPYWRMPANPVEQSTLRASDRAEMDYLGYKLALSRDGMRVIAGMETDPRTSAGTGITGSARIFVHEATGWREEATLVGEGRVPSDRFGQSVAISADGSRALVGGTGGSGTVRVFLRTGSVWTQEALLTDSSGSATGQFGLTVALSGNGDRAVMAVQAEDVGPAYESVARVFVRSGTAWAEEDFDGDGVLDTLLAPVGSGLGGSAVISADGERIAVGPRGIRAAPVVFGIHGGGVAIDAPAATWGFALNDAGDRAVVVGADALGGGVAVISHRTGSSWEREATVRLGTTAPMFASLSSDGHRALVGAYTEPVVCFEGAGAAYVLTIEDGAWTRTATLLRPRGGASDAFGGAAALSGDGHLAAMGVSSLDRGTGEVSLFALP